MSSVIYWCLGHSNSVNFRSLYRLIYCYLLLALSKFKRACCLIYGLASCREGISFPSKIACTSCLHEQSNYWSIAYKASRLRASNDSRYNGMFRLFPFCSLSSFSNIENVYTWHYLHKGTHWIADLSWWNCCQSKTCK